MVTSFGRRQLHTIVSREIIKPTFPTPSHLKIHNLSLVDQFTGHLYIPMVVFYPNPNIYDSCQDITLELKKSLSQTLSKYYPFAGKYTKIAPAYVDCNDDGVDFIEAHIDSPLSDFLQNAQHEDITQFIPDGRVWHGADHRGQNAEINQVTPLLVQVNHFKCGGLAMAVSLSHKIAEGSSISHFFNDWATITRCLTREHKHEFPIEPQFITFKSRNLNFDGTSFGNILDDCVTRSFMFPNSKLNDLESKITSGTMESLQPIRNPTRVEVLTWLIFKCMVTTTTKINPCFSTPTSMMHVINMRDKMVESLSETCIGNFIMFMEIQIKNPSETNPEAFINQLKKQKMEFRGLRNIETMLGLISNMFSGTGINEFQKTLDDSYFCSSLCRYPIYGIDFGWGKPIKVTLAGNLRKNSLLLMDSSSGDGIEALVCLEKQNMTIFQSDPELCAFC